MGDTKITFVKETIDDWVKRASELPILKNKTKDQVSAIIEKFIDVCDNYFSETFKELDDNEELYQMFDKTYHGVIDYEMSKDLMFTKLMSSFVNDLKGLKNPDEFSLLGFCAASLYEVPLMIEYFHIDGIYTNPEVDDLFSEDSGYLQSIIYHGQMVFKDSNYPQYIKVFIPEYTDGVREATKKYL